MSLLVAASSAARLVRHLEHTRRDGRGKRAWIAPSRQPCQHVLA